jgi:hypothetical protein
MKACSTTRLIAALTAACGCVLLSPCAPAGSLGSESSIGLQSAYNSNPYLLASNQAEGAESLALLVNLPIVYTGDESTFALTPRLRIGDTWGAGALLSDYQYLDGLWKFGNERNVINVTADWHRDSTLYNQYEDVALDGQTVRRLEELGAASWQRQFTERSDAQLQASIDHVDYGPNAAQVLYSYNYGQASAQFDRHLTELWQLSLIGGFGRYKLTDYDFTSDQRFVQMQVSRPLSDRWSISAQAGYSLLNGRQSEVQYVLELGPGGLYLVPVTVVNHSSAGTGSYAATVERRYERLTLDLAVSQAVEPSGFGALLTQDDLSLKGQFKLTERWDLGATVHGSRLYDSLHRLELSDLHYYNCDLYANWQWTEHWSLQLQTTLTKQKSAPLVPVESATAVYLTLSRQFGRVRLDKQ